MKKPYKLFSFRFSEIDYEYLRKHAKKTNQDISGIIREAIKNHIKNYLRRLK